MVGAHRELLAPTPRYPGRLAPARPERTPARPRSPTLGPVPDLPVGRRPSRPELLALELPESSRRSDWLRLALDHRAAGDHVAAGVADRHATGRLDRLASDAVDRAVRVPAADGVERGALLHHRHAAAVRARLPLAAVSTRRRL